MSLAKAGICAAKAAGVDFVLLLSSTTVGLPSTILGKQFGALEAEIRAADLPYSTLRCETMATATV